jgi:broad specificity phosphatase PhoE
MILMRHGQSEFNLHFSATKRDPGIADPRLTQEGQDQAERAVEALTNMGLTCIVVSPYTRALQTAAPIARALGLPVLINLAIRERYHFTCDIGTPRSELSKAWPHHDFGDIEEIWWPEATEPAESVEARAAKFLKQMQANGKWHETLVVSHWAFILALTGQSLANGEWIRWAPPTAT